MLRTIFCFSIKCSWIGFFNSKGFCLKYKSKFALFEHGPFKLCADKVKICFEFIVQIYQFRSLLTLADFQIGKLA
jgi:hypothetical protein